MLAMPLFFALMSLVVDGGNILVHKRNIQVAADAAALAMSQSINLATSPATCPASCVDEGRAYAKKNGIDVDATSPSWHECNDADPAHPTDTNCWAFPYVNRNDVTHPHYDQVEVRLRAHVTTFIAGVVGIYSANVSARTVAGTTAQVGPPSVSSSTRTGTTDPGDTSTIVSTSTVGVPGNGNGVAFAKSTACPAITYNGTAKGAHMGSFATNGGVSIGGNSDKTIDLLGIGKRDVPGCFVNQADATINQVVGPFAPMDWPLPLPAVPTPPSGCFDLGSVSMTFTAGPTHPSGIYCLTGATATLTLSSNLAGGNGYTFFAPCISVSGGTYKSYQPPSGPAPSPPTLLYASGVDSACGGAAISIQGGGATINGDIFAPNGQVSLQGGGVSAGTGFIESQTIKITGNSANFQGNGPIVSGTTTTTSTSVSTRTGTTDPGTTVTTTTPGATTGTTVGLGE
jgi:hypothetical protein